MEYHHITYVNSVKWVIDANRCEDEPYRLERLDRVQRVFYTFLDLTGKELCESIKGISLYDHKGVLTITITVDKYNRDMGGLSNNIDTIYISEAGIGVFKTIKYIWEGVENETQTEFILEKSR